MQILDQKQVNQRVIRLAYEIVEQNISEKKVYIAGINNNGYAFAQILLNQLSSISENPVRFELFRLRLNPANPIGSEIQIDIDENILTDQVIIIIDDVANTGRTLFYAFKPFLNLLVKKIQVAVLVDRKHKNFPVDVDYVGLSLATTLKNDIKVELKSKRTWKVQIF